MNLRSKLKVAGGILAVLTTLVGGFEGLRTAAYRDPVGIPTICYGETLGVRMGDVRSVEECRAMLVTRLGDFAAGLDKCIKREVPDQVAIATISWAYNVGLGAACKSTLVKRLNAGDFVGACNELPRWNKAGGKVLTGLVARRAQEQEICLAGTRTEAPPLGKPVVVPAVEKTGGFFAWLWAWLTGGL